MKEGGYVMKKEVYVYPNPPAPHRPAVFNPAICNGCNECLACQMDVLYPNPEDGKPPVIMFDEVGTVELAEICLPGAIESTVLMQKTVRERLVSSFAFKNPEETGTDSGQKRRGKEMKAVVIGATGRQERRD
jgi:hypothetical protein